MVKNSNFKESEVKEYRRDNNRFNSNDNLLENCNGRIMHDLDLQKQKVDLAYAIALTLSGKVYAYHPAGFYIAASGEVIELGTNKVATSRIPQTNWHITEDI